MNRFGGGLLIAIGVIIALLSGLCTLALGVPSLLMGGPRQIGGSILLLAVVGGAPFMLGVGLAILGHRIGWGQSADQAPAARAARRASAVIMILLGALIAFASLLGMAAALTPLNAAGLIGGVIGIAVGAGLAWGGMSVWRDPPVRPRTDVF